MSRPGPAADTWHLLPPAFFRAPQDCISGLSTLSLQTDYKIIDQWFFGVVPGSTASASLGNGFYSKRQFLNHPKSVEREILGIKTRSLFQKILQIVVRSRAIILNIWHIFSLLKRYILFFRSAAKQIQVILINVGFSLKSPEMTNNYSYRRITPSIAY